MIFDASLQFCNAQAITVDAPSTNTIDLGDVATIRLGNVSTVKGTRDIGSGDQVPLICWVVEGFNNLTSLSVIVQMAADTSFTIPVEVYRSAAIPLASLTKGGRVPMPDRLPGGLNLRYVRLYFDVTGTPPSTGKISAGIGFDDRLV